jgi:hypothetical protein
MIQCWCRHGFFFVSGMVTYFWFGHLGLFWYGLEVVLVRSTFQINSKCAFGVVICDFPPLLVWSMDLTRTEWPYYRKLCGIRVGVILTAARIWLGHFFASGMVRFALVVLARSHRPRWLRMSVLVWSRAHFLRWGSLWPLLVWSSSCFGVVKGALSSLGLSLATFGVVFFLFWCGQGRTFFVGALFDPTISEHAQCPKERPS